MICKIDGCDKEVRYINDCLCQMHYFRFMRNGTYELLPRTRKYKYLTPNGYFKVFEPTHPLADSSGYVFEHRFVLYNHLNGEISHCEMCKTTVTWVDCHVDHINNDRTNNSIGNLRIACRACNCMRGHMISDLSSFNRGLMIKINGVEKSIARWAATDGVNVTYHTIKRRLSQGFSNYDAVFGDKKTHIGKIPKKRIQREWSS